MQWMVGIKCQVLVGMCLLPVYFHLHRSIYFSLKQSETEMWGSAITDHAMKENHVIDWDSAKIVERERDDQARGVNKAVHIQILPNMNRDEGRHHLSHLYDDLLGATART